MENSKKGSKNIGLVLGLILAMALLAALLFLVTRTFSKGSAFKINDSKNIVLNLKDRTVKVGEEIKLINTNNAEDVVKDIEWRTSDENIATVSEAIVKGVSPGVVIIKAFYNNKEISYCTVTVKENEDDDPSKKIDDPNNNLPKSISLDIDEYTLKADETIKLYANIEPSDATNKTVTWSSSESRIALVREDGTVIGIGPGTAIVTVKTVNDLEASVKITVEGYSQFYDAYIEEIEARERGDDPDPVEPEPEQPETPSDNTIPVQSISLNYTSVTLDVGGSGILEAYVYPDNATNKKVTWSSSNRNVATVSNGKVTAKKAGTATITAKTSNGKKATCKVTVKGNSSGGGSEPEPEDPDDPEEPEQPTKPGGGTTTAEPRYIVVNRNSITLSVGATDRVVATVSPDNADQTITWSSNNTSIAKVNSSGVITGVAPGVTSITATAKNGVKAQVKVTVTDPSGGSGGGDYVPLTGLSLNKSSITLNVGSTSQLSVTYQPTNTTEKGIVWSTSNKNIVTVDQNGKVTAVASGSVTITAKSNNGKYEAYCTVNVNKIAPTGVSLNKTSVSLQVGSKTVLVATVTPSNSNSAVTWKSSNTGIATVDANGTVTAKAVGSATITVTTSNGKTATCKVTVTGVAVTSVRITSGAQTIYVGRTANQTYAVFPDNATDKTVTWKSSDTSIFTVDGNGKLKGVKAGTATVTLSSKNGKTDSVKITVKNVKVEKITITNCPSTIKLDSTYDFNISITPSDATDKSVKWTSGSTVYLKVVDASAGKFKAVKLTTDKSGPASAFVESNDNGAATKCSFKIVKK